MRLSNKHNKKEFQSRISELENELAEIKKTKTINQNDNYFNFHQSMSLLVEYEGIDILALNTQDTQIKLLNPTQTAHVIKNTPTTIVEFEKIIHPDDINVFKNAIEKLQSKTSIRGQIKLLFEQNGSKETKAIEFTLISKSPEEDVFIVIRDISEFVKQKKELIKNREKMEESDKLKSTILSNISHQIRTPLNSVTGFSELLATSEYEPKIRKQYINIIKQQSNIILNLIDDISEIAKLESGNINITKTACNLNLILNELLIGINQQIVKKRKEEVEITFTPPLDKGIELYTDSGRLQQAINNILSYSLRHTKKGHVNFGYNYDSESQKIKFFIHDSSLVLSKEEQKVIFNKFTLIDNSSTGTKLEDPGLGLTIARNIIKTLNGKIWVESDEARGNSFYFTLPYEHVPQPETEEFTEELNYENTYEWPNKVILIVDDEEVNAMFLDAVFHETNVQLLFAKNGLEAFELVKNISKIDLILMDLKMPVMNGVKATSEIRKINNKVPIIAQTALASEEDRQNCLHAGCNDTITKPIEVEELLFIANKYLAD